MNLTKQFFAGGNATFTVQNNKGQHYTFKIRQPKGDNKPHFVSLLTGPDNEHSYTYLGILNLETAEVRLTAKSKMNNESVPVKVVRWALSKVWNNQTLPEGYDIRHEGRCGCCGRTLTTPESLDRGIGPECWARMGGI